MTQEVRLSAIFFMLIATPLMCFAQETAPASPAASAPPRLPVTTTIGVQLSGIDLQYADVMYATLSVQQSRGPKNWHLRSSYSGTSTESSKVTNTRLDYRLEKAGLKGRYNVWTGILSRYNYRSSSRSPSPSGYHFISFGPGRKFDARNKGELGIGMLTIYDDGEAAKPALNCSIIASKPLSKSLTFDARILALQPMDKLSDTKVDSEIGLSYALTQGLSLRLSWSANNVLRNVSAEKDWTSNKRLTLSFNKTTTR